MGRADEARGSGGKATVASGPKGGVAEYALFFSARLAVLGLACAGVAIYEASTLTIDFTWTCMVYQHDSPSSPNSTAASAAASSSPAWTASTTGPGANESGGWPGKLHWDKRIQTELVMTHAIAEMLFRAPAGFLVDRYGAYLMVGLGSGVIGLATLLMPTMAFYGHWWMVGLRFLGAAAYAPIESALYNLISVWVPAKQSGFALATTYSGFQLGPLFMLMFAGLECDTIGWPWVFYTTGTAALVFAALWLLLYTDGPETSRIASRAESDYIIATRDRSEKTEEAVRTPIGAILRSGPVWAIIVGGTGSHYANQILRHYCPIFFSEILHMAPTSNGVFSALPYLAQLVSRNSVGFLSDWLARGRLGRTGSLKLFNSVSFFGAALGFGGLALMREGTPEWVAVGLNVFTMFVLVTFTAGFQKSPIYIAPVHSGVIGAITYTLGAAVMTCETYYIGWQTRDYEEGEWRLVFLGGAAVTAATAVVFLLFGSGDLQPWAQSHPPLLSTSQPHKPRKAPSDELRMLEAAQKPAPSLSAASPSPTSKKSRF